MKTWAWNLGLTLATVLWTFFLCRVFRGNPLAPKSEDDGTLAPSFEQTASTGTNQSSR